jgi:hypothetical protein
MRWKVALNVATICVGLGCQDGGGRGEGSGGEDIISMFAVLMRMPGTSEKDWLENDFLIDGYTKKSRIS